jgi:RHS repeat-associated protein
VVTNLYTYHLRMEMKHTAEARRRGEEDPKSASRRLRGSITRTANSELPSASALAYYHADGNGNVMYLVNSSQTLAASYRYDAYGNSVSQSGPLASANVYQFSSKEWINNDVGYYYGYRFYAPALQRWLNRDPLGERGGINLYRYVENSPCYLIDPNGFGPIHPSPLQSPDHIGPMRVPPNRDGGKCDCEKKGGKWQTMAQHDFKGSVYDCVEHLLTSTLPGSVGLGTGMGMGGTAGGIIATGGSATGTGVVVATGGGAVVGAGGIGAVAAAICNTPACYH